jgi:hypothetical protein
MQSAGEVNWDAVGAGETAKERKEPGRKKAGGRKRSVWAEYMIDLDGRLRSE